MNRVKDLRDHVRGLAAAHGLLEKIVRAMIGVGTLPGVGQKPAPAHKRVAETLPEYALRMLAEGGATDTRERCAAVRAKLAAMRLVSIVTMPDARVREASHALKAAGERVDVHSVYALLGGSYKGNAVALATVRPELADQQWVTAKATLDCADHHLAALVRNGFVDELREGASRFGSPIDFRTLRQRVVAAFAEWRPVGLDIQGVKDVAIIRSGLRVGTLSQHSEGILDAGTELLLSNGIRPAPIDLHSLLAGDPEQHYRYLTRRARTVRDVDLPKRYVRGNWTLADLTSCLPPPIHELHGTALDPNRGSSRDIVTRADIGRIATNPHAQLQVVGAVVMLAGAQDKALRLKAGSAAKSAANLASPMAGTDITNEAQVAAAFAVIRLLLKSEPDRLAVQRANKDIDGWRHARHVYDRYLARPDLPEDTRTYLLAHRPAWPSGGDTIFSAVRQDLDAFIEASKGERDKDLKPYLADVPAFLRQVLEAQSDLEAFHDHVRGEVSKAEKKQGDGEPLREPIKRSFRTDARTMNGTIATVVYRYAVHRWTDVIDLNVQADRALGRQGRRLARRTSKRFGHETGDEGLFENTYVVELLGCTRDGSAIEYPLAILRLHRDFGFWPLRGCPDQAAFELKCERLREYGMSPSLLSLANGGIGSFAAPQQQQIQDARVLRGVFLFPLVEAHHSALIGALQVASRAVEALRVGDHLQWNVGEGLDTGYDDNDRPFSVLSSIPKKKDKPRKTPLNDQCEELTDKLVSLSCERFFKGGPLPLLRRAEYNGKGPEMEALVFCKRASGLTVGEMGTHCRLLMVGNSGFKTHYMKYIWSKLSRSQGSKLSERREAHGHASDATTEEYDVLTEDEDEVALRVRQEELQARGQWLRGARESALPDPPVQTLLFDRKRLMHDIAFLEEEAAGVELDKARERLRLVEAKVARAQAAA